MGHLFCDLNIMVDMINRNSALTQGLEDKSGRGSIRAKIFKLEQNPKINPGEQLELRDVR